MIYIVVLRYYSVFSCNSVAKVVSLLSSYGLKADIYGFDFSYFLKTRCVSVK